MDWKSAELWLNEMLKCYTDLGWVGTFGLAFIRPLKKRFDSGERTQELYDEIMALE